MRFDFDRQDLALSGRGESVALAFQAGRPGLPPGGRVRPVQGIQPSDGQLVLAGVLLRLRSKDTIASRSITVNPVDGNRPMAAWTMRSLTWLPARTTCSMTA